MRFQNGKSRLNCYGDAFALLTADSLLDPITTSGRAVNSLDLSLSQGQIPVRGDLKAVQRSVRY